MKIQTKFNNFDKFSGFIKVIFIWSFFELNNQKNGLKKEKETKFGDDLSVCVLNLFPKSAPCYV